MELLIGISLAIFTIAVIYACIKTGNEGTPHKSQKSNYYKGGKRA